MTPVPRPTWRVRDHTLYLVVLIPALAAIIGAAWFLFSTAWWLGAIYLGLLLGVHLAQARCCVGCPYRGRFCPAIFGVYLANPLSKLLYPDTPHTKKAYDRAAAVGISFVTAIALFPLWWLFSAAWWYGAVYLGLLLIHAAVFFPTFCPRCEYRETCPGGRAYRGSTHADNTDKTNGN